MMEENNRQGAMKREKMKTDALATSTSMNEMVITIATKAGANGKIFGSITPLQISQALKTKGYDIDRRKIEIVYLNQII
jgi:large subunit ribosomal protein L9